MLRDIYSKLSLRGKILLPLLLAGLTSVKSSEEILGEVIVGVTISDQLLEQIRAKTRQHLVAFHDSPITAASLPAAKSASWQPPPLQSPPVQVMIAEGYLAKTVELAGLQGRAGKLVLLNPIAPLEQAKGQLWVSIAVFCLVGVGFATLVGTKVTRLLTRRIAYLNKGTQKLASGEFTNRITLTGNDEISILATRLNYMAEQLAERDQKISLQVEQLEQTLQQLQGTQKQMITQEKLAALGTLLAGIAHEIRNPLNLINSLADISLDLTQELREEIDNQSASLNTQAVDYIKELVADIRENAAEIHQQGQRTEGIIQGMLMHARSESGSREPTEINALLARALKLAYHGVRAKDNTFKINLETNYDQSLDKVEVVPSDISRAFLNIFSNACYALQEKKREMGQEFNPVLSVITSNLGDKIEICIRDNGSGIPPDIADKIFDAFFTTKPPGEGTGLGLSITHDIIVGQHQGEINLETQLGDYTEIKLRLPLK